MNETLKVIDDRRSLRGYPTVTINLDKVGHHFNECLKKELELVGLYISKEDHINVRLTRYLE